MFKVSYYKYLLFCVGIIFFVSCDKDYNEVGSGILSDDNFLFEKDSLANVTVYNQADLAVQTNNLPINQLGVYTSNPYGKTSAEFVTQVSLAALNPTLPEFFKIDNVELTIPYYSTLVTTNSDGTSTYTLDSIHGTGKIKLKVYECKKAFEPYDALLNLKKYYSNDKSLFAGNLDATLLNDDSSVSQNEEFTFSPLQQTQDVYKTDGTLDTPETTTYLTPRMKLKLNTAYFQNKIFGTAASGKLLNNNLFQDYFRGLYFKAEQNGTDEAMAQMNFSQGKITIYYRELATADATTGTLATLVINLSGNTINFLENTASGIIVPTSNTPVLAEKNIYLKGGVGFHSYIDLFGDANEANGIVPKDTPNLLEYKAKNWIINEANLVFNVDPSFIQSEYPNRIYLYDAVNKRPLLDYYSDFSVNTLKPKYAKTIHNGILSKNADGSYQYKIRITDHVKNIIKNDSTNVRLGLVVTEDIAKLGNLNINKSLPKSKANYFNDIPQASILNPLGTILYGSSQSAGIPEGKRLKLEIFYTKPN